MKDVIFWIGLIGLIVIFYFILKPEKWENKELK